MAESLATKLWDVAEGDRYILIKKGKRGTGHAFSGTEEALRFALQKNADNYDVWFAQALFEPGTARKQVNALSAKSFWMDLDVEPGNDKKYATPAEAANALAAFCNTMGLPFPTLVSSGVGLQAHWILDRRIGRDQWEKSAQALKNAAKRLGLKQDTTRTADIASVMRLPGTRHLKDIDNPKPVQIGNLMPDVPVEEFERLVSHYIAVTAAKIANQVFDVQGTQRPNDANLVADGCGVVDAMRKTKGCVPEPIWMHVLQLLHSCVDGEKFAHEWSEGYEGYSHDATQEKFESKANLGPTLCATFEDKWTGPGDAPCLTCPKKGTIKSPIQLGVTMTQPFVQIETTNHTKKTVVVTGEPMQYVPEGYTVGREGVWYHDWESDKDIKILDGVPLVLESKDKSVDGGGTIATFKWQTPMGTMQRGTIAVKDLMDLKAIGAWLYDNDITGVHPKLVERVRDFMLGSVNKYSQIHDPGFYHERLGWTPKEHPEQGFVLGQQLITIDGPQPAKLNSDRLSVSVLNGFGEKGTLEGWASATEFIKDVRYMPHQFTVLMMFASPLFELCGFQGSIISLVGETGLGKSTAAYMGMSAYGVDIREQTKALETGAGSTANAFRERWYIAHNLPVLIDEAHTIKHKKVPLDQLIYDAANGTMRDVLLRSSKLRKSGNFNLITVLGCNTPILDNPVSVIPDAARKRVFEFNLSEEHKILKRDAVACYSILGENYGVAGRAYLHEVVKLREYIQSQESAIKASYANSSLSSEYRFKQWNVGVGRLAGEICERLGIIRFDYRLPIEWALKAIADEAANEVSPVAQVVALLSEYERGRQSKFTITRDDPPGWVPNIVMGELAGRYHKTKDGQWTLSIPKKVFQLFVREAGVDQHAMKRWETEHNIIARNVRLTTTMSSTWCYVIPISGDNIQLETP